MKTINWKQAGIFTLIVAALLTIEAKSAIGAYHQQTDHLSGLQWAAISLMFAILAIAASAIAGASKEDIRPMIRKRTPWARAISVGAIIVPMCFLASALKAETKDQRWESYIAAGPNGSPSSYELDQAVVNDRQADPYDQREARERMRTMRPGSVDLDITDGAFWIAAFFQSLLLMAADKLRVAPAPTAEEVKHWRSVAAGRKAAATRARNKAAREKKRVAAQKAADKAERKARGGFFVLNGGKSAKQ